MGDLFKRIDWSSLDAAGKKAALARPSRRTAGDVTEVVRTFRAAVEAIDAGGTEVEVGRLLAGLVEGGRQTSGAYKKTWR